MNIAIGFLPFMDLVLMVLFLFSNPLKPIIQHIMKAKISGLKFIIVHQEVA